MLKLFEKNTGLQIVLILVVTALLWMQPLADPQPMSASDGFAPLYSLLFNLHLAPLAAVIVAMLLVLVGGFLLNIILANANLVSQNSLLPTLFYTLFMSAGANTLTPTLIVGVISIAFVGILLLHSTLLTVPPNKICGAGAIIGICSMVYLPSLALLVAYLLIAVNYRLYSWRDWVVLLLGLLAPYLLLWSVLFLNNGLVDSLESIVNSFSHATIRLGDINNIHAIANVVLLAIFVVSLFTLWRRFNENTVVWQKNATTVLLTTLAAIATLFYSQLFPTCFQLFAIPFTFCANHRFSPESRRRNASRRKWSVHAYDCLFLLTIAAAILC